jgi:hypothetical protein
MALIVMPLSITTLYLTALNLTKLKNATLNMALNIM